MDQNNPNNPNNPGAIWKRFDEIEKTLTELNETFNTLYGRLDPVLAPAPSCPARDSDAPVSEESKDSEIVRRLNRHRGELQHLSSRILDILDLLQL